MNYSDNVDFFICTSMRLICKPSKKVTGFLSLIEFFYSYFFPRINSVATKYGTKEPPQYMRKKSQLSPAASSNVLCLIIKM